MSNERVTYAELKGAKGSKRHQIKPKGTKRSVSIPEKEITYADLNLQNALPALQGNDKKYHSKGLAAPPEKLIAGLLGLTCLVLICIIVVVIIIYSSKTPKEQSSAQTTGNQKDSHCGPCAKKWLTYNSSCYYISHEQKTWNESVMDCVAKNSHLLYIDSQEEMNFLKIFHIFPWIGVSRRTSGDEWVWTNGSVFSSKLLTISSFQESQGKNCAYLSSQDTRLFTESCSETKKYVCKHWVQKLT